LYGTTKYGGAVAGAFLYGEGTLFRVDRRGRFATVHSFGGEDGSRPDTPLVEGADGSLYGTTPNGGAHGVGTLYRVDGAGGFATVHAFAADMPHISMAALTLARDGSLYGTTFYPGAVFRLNPGGGVVFLHVFQGGGSTAPLVEGSDGALYGTLREGSFGE